jgi:hypothetical protein
MKVNCQPSFLSRNGVDSYLRLSYLTLLEPQRTQRTQRERKKRLITYAVIFVAVVSV